MTSNLLTNKQSESDSPEAIARFEYPRTVRFVDTDASGFAHFASYVRMMEETEYAFLRSRGLSVKLTDDKGVMGFPRLHASFQIDQPLSFDQQVIVYLNLIELDGKSICYEFEIRDLNDQVHVTGKFQVALCRFPDDKPPFAILTPDYVIAALSH
jgi:YbgC/YbaW family acyl-CoA thioester hydrolase